ncbi:MAG: hypothetical protein PWQ67_2671, partial [Clostridia bacterium]|nr:hypothetical protein [Clostridia bacterium]
PGFYLKFAMPNNIPEMSSILQQPHTQGIHFNFSFAIAVMSLYTNLVDEPTNLKSTLHEDSL